MNYLVLMRWREPEEGSHAFIADLSQTDLQTLENAIDWLEAQAGDSWGDTVPAFEITEAQKGLSGGYNFNQAMGEIKTQSRYEEGIFEETYGPFEARCDLCNNELDENGEFCTKRGCANHASSTHAPE